MASSSSLSRVSTSTPAPAKSKPVTSKESLKPVSVPTLPSVPLPTSTSTLHSVPVPRKTTTTTTTAPRRTSSSRRPYPYSPSSKNESDVDKFTRYQELLKNVPREVLVEWMLPRLPINNVEDRLFIDQVSDSNVHLLSLILSRLNLEQQAPYLYTSLVTLAQHYDTLKGIELLLDGLTAIEIKIILSKIGVPGTAKRIASMDYASLIQFIAEYSNNEGGGDLKPLFAAAAMKRRTALTSKSNPSKQWDEPSRVMKPVRAPNAKGTIDPLHRALTYDEETALVSRLMREIATVSSSFGSGTNIEGKTYTEEEKKGVRLVDQMMNTVVKEKKSALVKKKTETPEEVATLLNQPENLKPARRIPRKRTADKVFTNYQLHPSPLSVPVPTLPIAPTSSSSIPIPPSIPPPSSSATFGASSLPFNPHSQPRYQPSYPQSQQFFPPSSSSLAPLPPPWFGNPFPSATSTIMPSPPPPSSTVFRDRKKLKL